jgi:hypothetical protein
MCARKCAIFVRAPPQTSKPFYLLLGIEKSEHVVRTEGSTAVSAEVTSHSILESVG